MLESYEQSDGSLSGSSNPYIEWEPGARWIEIDGYLTTDELVELAVYVAQKEGIDLTAYEKEA